MIPNVNTSPRQIVGSATHRHVGRKKMLRQLATLVLILLILVIPSSHAADPVAEELARRKMPSLPDLPIETTVLPNGATVYYLRDGELPIFRMGMYFEFGAIYDTWETRGLHSLFTSLWRSGGSQDYTPDQLDEKLESLAASISAGGEAELSELNMTCLMKDVDEILPLYFSILFQPTFDQGRMEVIRKSMLNEIKRRNEEPMPIVAREFRQSLFGEKSPHAWKYNEATVQAITREALLNYYAENIAPDRMKITAVSPLPFAEFLALIKPKIADWKMSAVKKEYPTHLEKKWAPSVEFIQKAGNQSAIVMGHFGDKRHNPDKFKLILADELLGGATFGAKLGDRIRTELGLAYGVESSFNFGTDFETFLMATRTKSESTLKVIEEMRRILTDMVNGGITQEELDLARERLLGRLIFEYEQPYNTVVARMRYDYFGYPPDYLKIYQREIEAITLDELKEVLPKYLFPGQLKLMIVGDKNAIGNMESLGGIVDRTLDME